MDFPKLPKEFSTQACNNVVAAEIKANKTIGESRSARVLVDGEQPNHGWLIIRWALTVMAPFATAACELGSQEVWRLDQVARGVLRFLFELIMHASEKYERPGYQIPEILDLHRSSILPEYMTVIEQSDEWKIYQNELATIADPSLVQSFTRSQPLTERTKEVLAAASAAIESAKQPLTPATAKSPSLSVEVDRRKLLLEQYKSATKASNRKIYRAKNSGIHKPQFYDWLHGDLSVDSQTTVNFERFLKEKKAPIPREPQG